MRSCYICIGKQTMLFLVLESFSVALADGCEVLPCPIFHCDAHRKRLLFSKDSRLVARFFENFPKVRFACIFVQNIFLTLTIHSSKGERTGKYWQLIIIFWTWPRFIILDWLSSIEYRPVMSIYLLGEQRLEAELAPRNFTPSWPILSIFGVGTFASLL